MEMIEEQWRLWGVEEVHHLNSGSHLQQEVGMVGKAENTQMAIQWVEEGDHLAQRDIPPNQVVSNLLGNYTYTCR